jgi:hypothetical protein
VLIALILLVFVTVAFTIGMWLTILFDSVTTVARVRPYTVVFVRTEDTEEELATDQLRALCGDSGTIEEGQFTAEGGIR